ncbi:MAG: fibronectin type III domain-containing protein, partial [Bacteroidota bacterium]
YSKGDTNAIKLCKLKAAEVHAMCKTLLIYAKPICYNNIELVILSGFDFNRQPTKHQAPRQPRILKVIKTGGQFKYKVILAKIKKADKTDPNPDTHQRDVRYVVELTLTPEDETSWNNVCVNAASNKLIFDKVIPGQRNFVRVYGTNAAGMGKRSANFYFTPELP